MSGDSDSPDGAPAATVRAWVDEVADRFDAAWRHGPRPAIAPFLGDERGARRAALLAELVKIDLEYRWKAGERPDIDAYRAEFPDLAGPDGALPEDLVQYAAKLRRGFGDAADAATTHLLAEADVRCPHCRNPIPLTEGRPRRVICPSCGASFRLEPGLHALVPEPELPRMLARFQLLELLGSGSFGTVYKAHDAELDRLVAVKLPRAGCFATPEEEGRFLREARSAAQLNHPGIVPVHEVAYQDGLPYLVSDYVEGRTLAAALAERRPGFRESAELAAQIADALDYAHRHGVIHRDVSPRNILLDAAGRPHVTDFGLARRDEGSVVVTREGQILGTPAYMSPEQAAGEHAHIDGRSDVYSLGVILYELLTGEPPFRGTITALLRQVVEEEPRPPRRLNDRIPRDLETVCLKALAKSPARRYATAGDLAADLRRWLKGEPIRARPVGRAERLWRWCRRNPRVAGLTAAVAFLLVAVAVGAVWGQQLRLAAGQARADKARARQEGAQARVARGLLLLEDKNELGLLDLLEARKQVEDLSPARESFSLLWSGWHAACAGRLAQVFGHDGEVRAVAFSPDGKVLATGGKDATLRLWDPATGRPLCSPLPLPGAVERLAFRPDGRFLVADLPEGRARVQVYDRDSGWALVRSLPSGRPLLSPDGRWLAVLASDEASNPLVQLYSAGTWEPHGTPLRPSNLQAYVFSPDGNWLAVADRGVEVWETASGRLVRRFPGPGTLLALAFSADGKWLAGGGEGMTAQVWDTATWTPHGAPMRHREHIRALAFSPDGKLLATASFDGTARLWDPATGQPRSSLLRHPGPVVAVAFPPDGRLLATRTLEGTVRLWDPTTGEPHGWLVQHQGTVPAWDFSPDGKLLATGSSDGTARVWDLTAGEPPGRTLPHEDRVWAVAFTPDGRTVATASEDGTVRLWDTATGKQSGRTLRLPDRTATGAQTPALAVALSPDGHWLAAAGGAPWTLYVWDRASRRLVRKVAGLTNQVRAVAFSPDGTFLAAAAGGEALLWHTRTWERFGAAMHHDWEIDALAIGPDNRLLATASKDRTARLWDAATGGPHGAPLRHREWVEAVAFSPDGKIVATASRDLTVRLWDTATGEPHGQPYQQQSDVQALDFSPDGKLLATASADETARLWDLATGLPCGPAMRHDGFATAVAFSPDGQLLATGAFDKTARLWRLPSLASGPADMERRTWVALGARLSKEGLVEAIPWKEWQRLRDDLHEQEAAQGSRTTP